MSDDRPIRSRDLELFRTIRNALTAAAHDRGQDWPEADQRMIARFFLEYIEAKKRRIVPIQPDRLMQGAINHADDNCLGRKTQQEHMALPLRSRRRAMLEKWI